MNFFKVQVASVQTHAIELAFGGSEKKLRLPRCKDFAPAPGAEVLVGVRPEAFRDEAPDGVTIEATVKVVESLGRETLLYVDGGPLPTTGSESQEGYIAVHRPSQETVAYGSPIRLAIDPRDVFVFAPDGPTLRYPERQIGHRLNF